MTQTEEEKTQRKGDVKIEAEIAAIQSQAKECWQQAEAGRGKERILS